MPERPPILGAVIGGAATAADEFIKASDQGGQYETGDPAAIYTDYEVRSCYEKDRHIYMMPVTSPEETAALDGTVAFVQLAMPTLIWIADWTARRQKEKPEMPDPRLIIAVGLGQKGLLVTIPDKNWVLLDDCYEAAQYTLLIDGETPVWRLSGTYVYGHRKPALLTVDNITFPRSPEFRNVINRRVATTSLKHNIID